jgi:hypothetical protein
MPSPGWRLEGRAWLERPVLHWEDSQIECSGVGTLYSEFVVNPNTQIRAKIEVWEEDIFRLWGRTGESSSINPLVHRGTHVD